MRFYAQWNGFLAGYSDWFTRIDDVADFARAQGAEEGRRDAHVPGLARISARRTT